MSQAAPRVVLFDLGGVVVKICRSFTEAAARAGVPMRHDDAFLAPDKLEERRWFREEYETGRMTCETYFALLSKHFEGRYSAIEIEAVHRAWVIEEYEGIAALVDRLQTRGEVQTGCLSNTNHAHWQGMLGLDLAKPGGSPALQVMAHKLASHRLGAAKPSRTIYELAQHRVAAHGPQIAFFDDLPANIDAARSLGWNACLIDHTRPTAPQIEAHLIGSGISC